MTLSIEMLVQTLVIWQCVLKTMKAVSLEVRVHSINIELHDQGRDQKLQLDALTIGKVGEKIIVRTDGRTN